MSIKQALQKRPLVQLVLSYGINQDTPENEYRFIKMLNISIVLFILYSSACVLVGLVSGDYQLALFQIPCFAALALAIVLTGRGRYTSSVTIVLGTLIVAFSSLQIFYGGDANLHIWLLIPIMGACLAYPPSHNRHAMVMGLLAIVALTLVEYLDIPQKIISPLLDTPAGKANNIAALGFAILGVAFVSRILLLSAEAELIKERLRSENLLNQTLPKSISKRLKNAETVIADDIDSCSVLFCDIVGFTELSNRLSAHELVDSLNELFILFDELCEKYGVEKIKTIGDAYMVAAGVLDTMENHADILVALGKDMIKQVAMFKLQSHQHLDIRIGIHSGPVVAGVIGKSKFSYDLWGDTVNVASRMESHGVSGKIQISEATYDLLKEKIPCQPRGAIEVKGKGMMNTFLVDK